MFKKKKDSTQKMATTKDQGEAKVQAKARTQPETKSNNQSKVSNSLLATANKENRMPKITIDNKEYDTDKLSDNAKAQLNMLGAADQEIARLNLRLAIAQTARAAYGRALSEILAKDDDDQISIQ